VLKYPNNEEDVGYWNGDKLTRLLVPVEANFVYTELDSMDMSVEIKSWYDRDNLLKETLNPQNIFLNTVTNSKSLSFIRNDPYMEKVLQQKKLLHEHYLNVLEDLMKQHNGERPVDLSEFLQNRLVNVDNLTPNLMDMFKHFKKMSCFNKNFSKILNIDLSSFEKCNIFLSPENYARRCFGIIQLLFLAKREYFGSAGFLETSSIQFLNACDEKNLDKLRSLRNYVDIDVCDNRGYSPLIISVVSV
jgi:hypothetical protein